MTEIDKIVEIVYEWINKEKTPTPRNLKSRLNEYFNTRQTKLGRTDGLITDNQSSSLKGNALTKQDKTGESRKAKFTEIMKKREEAVHSTWKDEGDGFFSMVGYHFSALAYIAIPEDSVLVDKDYNDSVFDSLIVNGGLTYGQGNVFGWDYGHYENHSSPEIDIPQALKWFKQHYREQKKLKSNDGQVKG